MKYGIALGVVLTLNAAANLVMKAGMMSVAASGGVLQEGLADVPGRQASRDEADSLTAADERRKGGTAVSDVRQAAS